MAGMRRVSNSAICPSHASSCASSGVFNFIDISDLLESQETLEWLGMDTETARMLFDRWRLHWAEEDPTPFVNAAIDHFRYSAHDAADLQDDWEAAMKETGFLRELRDAISDPGFQQARTTKSANDWLVDTLKMRARLLTHADNASKARVEMVKNGRLKRVTRT